MRNSFLCTSESVSEGHPDKGADQISDSVVDLFLSKDPEARVACETLTTTQLVVLAGEIRCKGVFENDAWAPGALDEIEATVRKTVREIGYEQSGFHWQSFRSEEHTSEPQSLMRISYAVLCLQKRNTTTHNNHTPKITR